MYLISNFDVFNFPFLFAFHFRFRLRFRYNFLYTFSFRVIYFTMGGHAHLYLICHRAPVINCPSILQIIPQKKGPKYFGNLSNCICYICLACNFLYFSLFFSLANQKRDSMPNLIRRKEQSVSCRCCCCPEDKRAVDFDLNRCQELWKWFFFMVGGGKRKGCLLGLWKGFPSWLLMVLLKMRWAQNINQMLS